MNTALVILAAGMGSRYGGNKQIDGIGPNGEVLMEYSIYDAVRAGFNKIVLIIKPDMREWMDGLFGKKLAGLRDTSGQPVCVQYVFQSFDSIPAFYHVPAQRVKPFGTLHAVLCAQSALSEPFAVINSDDYYGIDAYRMLHDNLVNMAPEGEAAIIAYKLCNTVSAFGTVTRGLCDIRDQQLISIHETYNIRKNEDGSIGCLNDDTFTPINPDMAVSMNMWGFTPWIFTSMRRCFDQFLSALAPDDLRGEYVLPVFVGDLLNAGEITVHAETTDSEWFGMTYREDKPQVMESLNRLHRLGSYPPTLY